MEDMCFSHESPSPMYLSDFEIKCPLSKSNAVSGSCDHNGGVLTSKNGDINITVPAGAIKYRDCVKFYIATDLYGPYALPSQCQNNLISPFYWIGVCGLYLFRNLLKLNLNILEHVILHIINCYLVKIMMNPTPCDLLIMS